ncbi:Ig-like domain-containing protein [Streptomyces sp. NPDC048604]|uniref:L,D-transpeptidase n=1 Tax=Streptomyces sp. NPDC048604 TaxID=3365578 RepID=UPI0037213B4C
MHGGARSWGAAAAVAGVVLLATAGQSPGRGPGAEPAARAAAGDAKAVVSVARTLADAAAVLDDCANADGVCAATAAVHRTAVLTARPEHARAGTAESGPVLVARPAGPVEITLKSPGALAEVIVADARGRRVAGAVSPDGTRWTSAGSIPAGSRFTARLVVEGGESGMRGTVGTGVTRGAGGPGGTSGERRFARLKFSTAPARADDGRLTVALGPGPGRYGVGQPLTAELSHPVPVGDEHARRTVERALEVASEPRVDGAWHWVGPTTLHYRPRTYWPAHATVRVRSALDGVPVTDRLVGGPSQPLTLTTGDRVEAVVDVATHHMTVRRNGYLVRTVPVTTGKAGYRTRGGIKVVLGKERLVRMRGDSIGIPKKSKDFYDLKVRWATRVTWSGEYLHAAPWSVDAQGSEDVSHGCIGMSTEDASWLYANVREGDLVQVVNGQGEEMTPFDNGYGDWNVPWTAWQRGSSLGPAVGDDQGAGVPLRPKV